MKTFTFFAVVVSILIFSCQGIDEAKSLQLTDENIQNYIAAYKNLREAAPDILQSINENPSAEEGQEQFSGIESAIMDAGLANYPQFVLLNAKIGSTFSIIQASKGMDRFQNLQNSSNTMFDDGMKAIQEQIDDPNIPEETKASLRETLEELKANQQEMNDTYEQNRVWADFVMETVEDITGYIVSEEDIELVKKYETELMEAYVGFPLPYENDGNMPKG